MSSPGILFITTIIMFGGGLAILFTGKRRTPAEGLHTVCHGIVPIIAACSYFAMATGQGSVMLHNEAAPAGVDRVFYYARYIDWSFTTPLLLLTLCMTAMRHEKKLHGAIVGAILADVLMIVTAFAFGASVVTWVKWAWFLISCISFLGVYYVLWVPNMEANAADRDDIRATYKRNASILSVVWFIYPIVLAVAPDGLGILSDASSVLCIAVLDVIAKVIYGLMTIASDTKATDRDLREDETKAEAGPHGGLTPMALTGSFEGRNPAGRPRPAFVAAISDPDRRPHPRRQRLAAGRLADDGRLGGDHRSRRPPWRAGWGDRTRRVPASVRPAMVPDLLRTVSRFKRFGAGGMAWARLCGLLRGS